MTTPSPGELVVVIPAFEPPGTLPEQVSELLGLGFETVIVVDDGSSTASAEIFSRIAAMRGCEVLRHAVNLGKGRALKTALNHFLLQHPRATGVVTVDADGQHRSSDVLEVAKALLAHPRQLVVGARQFGEGVPLRSRAGNTLTKWLFALLSGKRLADTQTGLRGIPRQEVADLLRLAGEHYDFEMNMLFSARSVVERPIAAVYVDGNRSSHFHPLIDSMRIYFVLARFYLSSLIASALDFVMFSGSYALTGNILGSLLAGRLVVGALVNFVMNKRFVFHSGSRVAGPLFRYYLLVGFMSLLSWLGIRWLAESFHLPVLLCKVMVEAPLSVVSFAMQREFVFDPEGD